MRAPTIPEAHLAAVITLTIALVALVGTLVVFVHPAFQYVIVPAGLALGFWLRWAWVMLRLQRRVAKAYAEQLQARAGIAGAATMSPEDLRKALGFEGRPAARPVSREEQAQ